MMCDTMDKLQMIIEKMAKVKDGEKRK